MRSPLPAAAASAAAAEVAPRLAVPRDRLARLLARGSGALTRPLDHAAASRIADVLSAAGVPVHVTTAEGALRTTSETWPDFEPTELDEEMLEMEWATGELSDVGARHPNHRASDRVRELPSDPGLARQLAQASDDRDEELTDVPMFDWNQPLGMARWRRPLLLVALLVALGVFALLQIEPSSSAQSVDSGALYERGLDAYRSGEFGRALDVWDRAAASGDPRALYMLGYMSEFGQGQSWSNRRAAEYYRQAAERGSVQAQVALASLYERGLGVPHSDRTAVRWYGLAAQNGHAEAQYRLGLAMLQGRGTATDYRAALDWFERAAGNGVRDADAFVTLLRSLPPSATVSGDADASGSSDGSGRSGSASSSER